MEYTEIKYTFYDNGFWPSVSLPIMLVLAFIYRTSEGKYDQNKNYTWKAYGSTLQKQASKNQIKGIKKSIQWNIVNFI